MLGRALPLLVLGIAGLSVGVAQATLATDGPGAFYLPTNRAFAFAIGMLVIFAEQKLILPAVARPLLAAAGLTLIAYAIARADST